MPSLLRSASSCLAALALSGCAVEPAAPGGMSVLVKLAQPSMDAAAIAAQVADAAGRPARYLSASSTAWHAVHVRCTDAADCDAALQRLRADVARFEAAQSDQRKRIVSP